MAQLNEFSRSLGHTREWIDDLMQVMDTDDEAKACYCFRHTVHALRDHLSVEEGAHLAAQLPILLRGLFYENWRPSRTPPPDRTLRGFLDDIAEHLPTNLSLEEVEAIVRDVFYFLCGRISPGEIRDVVNSLPKALRGLWPRDMSAFPVPAAAV